jgi:phosphoglycolate phosphatase
VSEVRAVVFDLDGTLVDSLPDITAALGAALRDHGAAAPALEVVRGWVGGGARQLVRDAVAADPGLGVDALDAVDAVLARFLHHYAAAPAVGTTVYPGIAAALDALVGGGVALAILTNKPEALACEIVAAKLAAWRFAVVRGARPGVALKPDPTAAGEVAAALGVAPAACAFVGDAPSDVATGRGAGMFTVGVTWGYRPRAELVAAGADVIVDDPAALAAVVAGRPG